MPEETKNVRAGVFVGVKKSGDLRELKDAVAGAGRMHDWAVSQGFTARLITDAEGPVRPYQIYDAIKELVGETGLDQLIVYFAGHGVNINRNEHWLLTEAPVNNSSAVNVSGSVELARYCGVQHTVFISDACRVAPDGIQAQNVRGIDIFPNESASDKAKPVDQFFACALGRTAAEVRDPKVSNSYKAIYTTALLKGLYGDVETIREQGDFGDPAQYVRPRKLQDYLELEIPRRLKELKLERMINQNPDALILDHRNWLARFKTRGHTRTTPPRPPLDKSVPETLRTITETGVSLAAEGDSRRLFQTLEESALRVPAANFLSGAAQKIIRPFGPDQLETDCGIKVRGKPIREFFAPHARGELLGPNGNLLRLHLRDGPAASVLLRFDGDVCAVIPAISGFIAGLTFLEGELVDVAYEPSANTPRWAEFDAKALEIRTLRAFAAASSQHGRFRIAAEDVAKVARSMQSAKGVDPTLAVYAAYAFHDMQATARLEEMVRYQLEDLGVSFFDLALLSRRLVNPQTGPKSRLVPFIPLLSQGWALLNASNVRLHPALKGLESDMQNSLWSLFDMHGFQKLKNAMETMEVL